MIVRNETSTRPNVLIIVPAFNESGAIREVIDSISGVDPRWDILIVNDGSFDDTGKIAAAQPPAMVIDLCSNLGIGGAMQTGFKYALETGYSAVVQIDGDGQHDASCIPCLLEAILSGKTDVAIGSRFHEEAAGSFRSTMVRRMGIRLLGLLYRLLTGYGISDVTSGFRAYNRTALSLVARHYPTDFPEPESFVLFRKAKLRVDEFPTPMHPRQYGISSISGLTSAYYMVKVLIASIIYSLRSKRDFYGDFNCRAMENSRSDSFSFPQSRARSPRL